MAAANPTSVDNLSVYFNSKLDTINVDNDGQTITSWVSAFNGDTFTVLQGAPTFNTYSHNGNPMVQFADADVLESDTTYPNGSSSGTPQTLFVVAELDNVTPHYLVGTKDGKGGLSVQNAGYWGGATSTSWVPFPEAPVPTTGFHILCLVRHGSTSPCDLWVDGVKYETSGVQTTSQDWRNFGKVSPNGKLGAVLTYKDTDLDDADIKNITAYLADEFYQAPTTNPRIVLDNPIDAAGYIQGTPALATGDELRWDNTDDIIIDASGKVFIKSGASSVTFNVELRRNGEIFWETPVSYTAERNGIPFSPSLLSITNNTIGVQANVNVDVSLSADTLAILAPAAMQVQGNRNVYIRSDSVGLNSGFMSIQADIDTNVSMFAANISLNNGFMSAATVDYLGLVTLLEPGVGAGYMYMTPPLEAGHRLRWTDSEDIVIQDDGRVFVYVQASADPVTFKVQRSTDGGLTWSSLQTFQLLVGGDLPEGSLGAGDAITRSVAEPLVLLPVM